MYKKWEDVFWDLYKVDIKKALAFKKDYIPKKLYRYRPLDKIENIKNEIISGKIYITTPREFNDVFDAMSLMSSQDSKFYFSNMELKDLYEDSYNYLPKDIFNEIFGSDDWFDKLIEYTARNIIVGTTLTIDDAKQKLNELELEGLEKINSILNDISESILRIACFTVKETNIPMWVHYTNDHSGVCIEYNTETIVNQLITNSLFPVRYVDKLMDGMEYMIKNDPNQTPFLLDDLATQKHDDWKYEQEWRLMIKMGMLYPSHDSIPEEYRKKGQLLFFAKPSKVILGYKIDEKNEKEIRKVCNDASIKVLKMKVTPYGLQY